MPKKIKVKGLKMYEVTMQRKLNDFATFYVQAPDIDTIKAMPAHILDGVAKDWCSDEYECSIYCISQVERLRKLGGERLSGYIVNGKFFDMASDVDIIVEAVAKHNIKPLPGQMGIPGVAKDVPPRK